MTNTTNARHALPTEATIDVHDMVVVHRAFRRELRLLPQLVREVPAGAVDRAALLAKHARLILTGLHLHHAGEDEHLWPVLEEHASPPAELTARMQAQHAAVVELLDQFEPVLARWESEARPAVGTEAASLFDRLHDVVVEHLDDEERSVLPLAARSLTAEQWATMGESGVAEMTPSQLPLMLGSVLEDTTPVERHMLLDGLPVPARLVMRFWGAGHYRRYIRKVRGTR